MTAARSTAESTRDLAPRAVERPRARAGGSWLPATVPLVVLVVWQIASLSLDRSALPSPWDTAAAVADGIVDGWLVDGIAVTLRAVVMAFVVAALAGLATGLWLGSSRFWGEVLDGPLLWTYALPKITVFPIFLLIWGLGESSRLAFGAFHGFFPLAIVVLTGVRAIPAVYLRSARSLRLSRWDVVRHVLVPAAAPSIFSGLRFCFSLCFLGVVLAEMFGSAEGAGYELVRRITLQQLPEIFAIALSLMAIALIVNLLMMAVERRLPAPSTATGRTSR